MDTLIAFLLDLIGLSLETKSKQGPPSRLGTLFAALVSLGMAAFATWLALDRRDADWKILGGIAFFGLCGWILLRSLLGRRGPDA